jgi:hypothetical protein
MPTENRIDCPALHKRSKSYPFGDRVPRTVKMFTTVVADPMPGIASGLLQGDGPICPEGKIFPAWTNSHGAVAAVLPDGKRLGLRPDEFEVDTWHTDPKSYPDRLCHIDYTAHPHRCGCLSGDDEAQRRFDEYQRDTKLATAESEVARLSAERDGLQLALNTADQTIDDLQTANARRNQRIDELERDKHRLDALESNCWDVRFDSNPNGDAGDSSISIEVVGHWMDKPLERVIGENYNENLRAAIDQAMTAPAYPPARPEYPEPESVKDDDWHMNPCKQGHRDVGASGGVAACNQCDETIEAATTQEAFERWNATHPAIESIKAR